MKNLLIVLLAMGMLVAVAPSAPTPLPAGLASAEYITLGYWNTPYTVPIGKALMINGAGTWMSSSGSFAVSVDNLTYAYLGSGSHHIKPGIVAGPGTVVNITLDNNATAWGRLYTNE